MVYESSQFRFPMGQQGQFIIGALTDAVDSFVRYAPNEGSGGTPRQFIRDAFGIVRRRLNRGDSIQSAISDLDNIAFGMRDM